MTQKASFVVLISGSGSNLQAIIDAIATDKLDGKIQAVISNRPDAVGLKRASKAGIPTHVINHQDYADRIAFDTAMIRQIDGANPDWVVLAGFMRLLTDEFVQHYQDRLINIHPSLLPKFKGLNTHQQALDSGETLHGASVHLVTPELDAGPVIAQATVPVLADDDAETLRKRVLEKEHQLYPYTLQLLASNEVTIKDGKLYHQNKLLDTPIAFN